MNVRNSIFNKISTSVEVLKEMKQKKIITNNIVEIEIRVPDSIDTNNAVSAKFKVKCDLDS